MSLIKAAGAGEQSTGFYNLLLDQSLKFDDGKASALSRTPASAGNQRLWTFSAWAKKSTLDIDGYLLGIGSSSTPEYIKISNSSTDQFEYAYWNGSVYVYQVRATALLRDTSAWYHIVLAVDTAQGTAANRVKFYVNGTQLTDFSISTYPTQNADTRTNAAVEHRIGSVNGGGYYDGYLAEVNFIDGTALTAASFGETKNGIWIPKDTSGLTFGTNGFHLTFKDDVISEGFNAVAYTGNAATQSVSGLGFSPGLAWIKGRSTDQHHNLFDVLRSDSDGPRRIYPSLTSAEESTVYSGTTNVSSLDADGFTMGNGTSVNESGETFVGWCWEAGGTPTADNSAGAGATPTAGSVKIDGSNLGSALAGSIAATRLSANTTKGFSIGTFTKGSGNETVAHGLGAAPDWLIVKRLNGTGSWIVYHSSNGSDPETDYLTLNGNGATADEATFWNDTAPTSTVFTVGAAFNSGETLVFYAWAEVSGYSKFGSFTGNGGSQAIDVGFTPAFVMLRRTNGGTWAMFDNTRQSQNLQMLGANSNAAETTNSQMTFSGNTFNDNGYISDNGTTVLYMAFADTREAAFFKDVSSNGNHFTPVNLDYRDSVPDTPTNNFSTMNPIHKYWNLSYPPTISEGNLRTYTASDYWATTLGNMGVSSGKWYAEFFIAVGHSTTAVASVGILDIGANNAVDSNNFIGVEANSVSYYGSNGYKYVSSTSSTYGNTWGQGDIIGVALDLDAGTVKFYKNNTVQNSGTAAATDLSGTFVFGCAVYNTTAIVANFGQDSSFAGNHATANANADENGHGSFAYAPPSAHLALCSQNLPNAAIIDGTDNFNTVLYTGNSGTQSITGVGFSPDWLWVKNRGTTYSHALVDSVRGATLSLASDSTAAERTSDITSLDSDGFSLQFVTATGSYSENQGSQAYVAWNWLAGTAFSNDASATGVGTIDSSGQVNTTAGFSIVTFTGGAAGYTVAHGLSAAPEIIFTFNRTDSGGAHYVFTTAIDGTIDYFSLNATTVKNNDPFSMPAFTSTVFSLDNDYGMDAGDNCVAYCFHSVEGYSKVGSYVGNGNADGPFVYTGFRPAWFMVKRTDTANNWVIYDNKRNPINNVHTQLFADLNNADASAGSALGMDFLSTGLKMRGSGNSYNASGGTYVYLAFAEQPFKFANAR